MSKLLGGLLVGLTALALSGSVLAAEQTKVRPNDPAAQAGTGGTAGAGTQSNSAGARANAGANADVGRSPEYNAELQRCDSMTGTEKTRCITAAEKKHAAAESRRNTAGTTQPNATQSEAYSADLQKCDAMTGAEKTRCVSAAKRKHGQM